MKAALKYPIFTYGPKENMIYVFWSDRDYKTTNISFLKKNSLKGDVIIDASGARYIVKSTYMAGWRGIRGFTGWRCGMISIENEYEDNPTSITLTELQNLIGEKYPKSRWFISEGWDNAEDFRNTIFKYKTFEELARHFRQPPHKNIVLRILHGW